MYFPYLYGRRAERNALIDVASTLGNQQKVVPIVEPYSKASDLNQLFEAFKVAGARLHVVVNPSRGTLTTPAEIGAWTRDVKPYLAQQSLVVPVMHVHASTKQSEVVSFLNGFASRDVAIVVLDAAVSPSMLASAIGTRTLRVFTASKVNAAPYAQALIGNHVVPLETRFPALVGATYPQVSLFSGDPTQFGAAGFGDYAVIDHKPPRVGGGGGAPGAVVLHMTFQDPSSKEVRVQHVQSNSKAIGSPPSSIKLLEAIDNLRADQASSPGKYVVTGGYTQLQNYWQARHPTSLEKSKQCQLAHHLESIAIYL